MQSIYTIAFDLIGQIQKSAATKEKSLVEYSQYLLFSRVHAM